MSQSLGFIQQGQEGRLGGCSLLLLPGLAQPLLLCHIPAEVIEDLAPLLGLVYGLVARIAH